MPLLLAQANVFLHLGDRFREANAASSLLAIAATALALACVGVAIWLWNYRQQKQAAYALHAPEALWDELCRAHHLNWSERRLLRRLALQLKLDQQARLFLEPELWESAAPGLTARQRAHSLELQRKLLG